MITRMHKPEWLYQTLPYVYVATGIIVSVGLQNAWGLFSGLMFITAGLSVFFMRKAYKQALQTVQAADMPVVSLEADGTETGKIKLVWRDVYRVGEPEIDEQHQHLFDMGNLLLDNILTNQPRIEVEFFLETMLADISHHFSTEEAVLARNGHPISNEHRQIHMKLLARADELAERYRAGHLEVGDLFGFIAYDVVAMHIVKEDKRLFAHA